jgi:medium-chain acyl-[acyl-carrier-protein] hydrolase
VHFRTVGVSIETCDDTNRHVLRVRDEGRRLMERRFTNWITCPRPNPGADLRMFCLSCAGAGASMYRAWASHLPASLEVCPVQLPGREERHREPPITSLLGLSRATAREMTPFLDRPFVLFGHSMGALLAFELARTLRHALGPVPVALILAAYSAPQSPPRAPIHHLPDAEFIDEMRKLQGTSEAVLQNQELMAFVLPTLRADFQACDTYRYAAEAPLDCPIVIYGGLEDREVGVEGLDAWRSATSGPFERVMLPGNHFFIQSQRDALLADIGRRVAHSRWVDDGTR